MNTELCFPAVPFAGNNHKGSVPPEEYGGSTRECIEYVRENAPDSDLDAMPVHIPNQKLPNGKNY